MKSLRGGRWDIFGKTEERQAERKLITDFEELINKNKDKINEENYLRFVEIANLPQMIKGFGHVKQANMEKYERQLSILDKQLTSPALKVVMNG